MNRTFNISTSRLLHMLCVAATMSFTTFAASAQSVQNPYQLEGVRIEDKLGDSIPLDVAFVDHNGREVSLADYFNNDKPVVLVPVYYVCPQLCSLVLNGFVAGMKDKTFGDLAIGEDFELVAYSFNEEEGPDVAAAKRKGYIRELGKDLDEKDWPFLTGSKESIDKISNAIGFHFKRQDDGEIAHSASVVFLTPDGRISRYMNDVAFKGRDLKLALSEASQGTIGTAMERFLLFTCLRYDSENSEYVLGAWKLMRSAGVVTILLLGGGLLLLLRQGGENDPHNLERNIASKNETRASANGLQP